MAPSQEDEWKLMVDHDPHSGSVAGDSMHGTMAATGEDEPINSTEELVGAVEGVDESVLLLSISLMSNGEMMTLCLCLTMRMSPSPKHQLLPQPQFKTWEEEDKAVSLGKNLAFESQSFERLLKTAPTPFKRNYNDSELVGYTRPSLVNVIPTIKYEAQNMSEPSFR